jgi:subtilase family serine protease
MPGADPAWGTEEMLDLEMVSAACPTCSILYVGADSPSLDDLGAAVNTAVKLGAKVVSNSYGSADAAHNDQYQAKYYQHPGVAITASSGDYGYGVEAPAAYNSVIAVGGTSLTLDASGARKSETAWGDAGSGCSRFTSKPVWQHDGYCAHRTVADVSAVADPDTGVAVYDEVNGGWLIAGGTSVSAPFIAGIYGLTGHTSGHPAQRLYTAPHHSLYDVTSGLNGTCSSDYLCSGMPGYDAPTGVGSPNGVGAF